MRRRQLMATAAAGQPNKLLTLTVNITTGDSAGHRRDLLHDAWKKLVKRILRQFQLAPDRRWKLEHHARSRAENIRVFSITQRTPQAEIRGIPYFAFLERTKRGEPHLHILLRTPFIPQDWLSEQMQDLLGSPIVWIEAIKGSKHAIAYVTKYVTKEPAQWGNKKRYWQSRNWRIKTDDDADTWTKPTDPIDVDRIAWRDLLDARVRQRWTIRQSDDGWFTFWRPGQHAEWAKDNPDMAQRVHGRSVPEPRPP